MITWAVTDPNPITSKSLTVNGTTASIGGPYSGAYYYYELFGPVSAGPHTIAVTDSKGGAANHAGTFSVAALLMVSAAAAPQGEAASLTVGE